MRLSRILLQINVVPLIDVMFALLFSSSQRCFARSEGLSVNLGQNG